jgi:hypothetical protein
MTPERTVDRPPEALSHHWNRHKSRHLILRAAIGIACLALGGPTVAGAANGYAGLCIGNAGPTIDRGRIPFHTRDVAPDATAWRLFAGYTVTRNFAVEGGYISLGKVRVTEYGGGFFETEVSGFELGPVGIVPVGRHFSLLARAGLIFWRSDICFSHGDSGSGAVRESGTDLSLSLGARCDFSRRFGVRAEYSRYAIDKSRAGAGDFDVVTISGVVTF